MFVGAIFGDCAAPDKRKAAPLARYFLSSGLIRSSSSSNGIEPCSRTPLRKKVGVEVTFNS
jgi:hypothetical protein